MKALIILLLVLSLLVVGCGVDYSEIESKDECLAAGGVWEPTPVSPNPPEKIGTCSPPEE
jgi:hypothetical protein